MKNKGIKPRAYRMSQWGSKKEILYKCPKCGQALDVNGYLNQYCFHCGQKLDWDVLIEGNEQLVHLYHTQFMDNAPKQKLLMDEINNLNKKLPYDNTPKGLIPEYTFQVLDSQTA